MPPVDRLEVPAEDLSRDDAPTLEDFLRSRDSFGLPDREIAKRFLVKTGDVKRARKVLQDQLAVGPDIPESPPAVNGQAHALPHTPQEAPGVPLGASTEDSEDESTLTVIDPTPALPAASGDPSFEPGLYAIQVSQLDLDSGTRIRDLDGANVRDIEEVLKARGSTSGFDPLGATWVPELSRLLLTDGFHRVEGTFRTLGPNASWQAQVKVGTYREALADAFRANRKHGKRLTREDRILIVERVLDDEVWGPRGQNWNDRKIAELVGEDPKSGRQFVGEVRKDWLKKQGLADPTHRMVERDGVTYPQKVKAGHPRGHDDQAEDDETQAGQEPSDSRRREIDTEYLTAVPCRAHIHPDLLPSVDQSALARRELTNAINFMKKWAEKWSGHLGANHPLLEAVDRAARIPPAITEGEHSRPWVACGKCKDAEGKSTGLVTVDGEALTCKTCRGTGVKLPGI